MAVMVNYDTISHDVPYIVAITNVKYPTDFTADILCCYLLASVDIYGLTLNVVCAVIIN